MKRALDNIYEAYLMGCVEVHLAALNAAEKMKSNETRTADTRQVSRPVYALGALVGVGVAAPAAYAASGCENPASTKLLGFISTLANFLIGLGAGIALLMLAVGALFIIAGGTPDRVSKGMKMIKNVVIGLAVLGAGAFIKVIVTTFIRGATSGTANSPACLEKGKL